ncbi:MAG TPA: hypothetical protein VGC34_04235 [Steroidobacteraceae bacterium]
METTAIDTVDGKFVVYFDTGGRQALTLAQVSKFTSDIKSWMRFLHMMMTGTPARMKIRVGKDKASSIFLVLPNQVHNGMQYADLDSRYPETRAVQ